VDLSTTTNLSYRKQYALLRSTGVRVGGAECMVPPTPSLGACAPPGSAAYAESAHARHTRRVGSWLTSVICKLLVVGTNGFSLQASPAPGSASTISCRALVAYLWSLRGRRSRDRRTSVTVRPNSINQLPRSICQRHSATSFQPCPGPQPR